MLKNRRSNQWKALVAKHLLNQWNEHLVKLPLDPPKKVEFGIAYTSKEHMTSTAKKFYDYAVKYITKK